MTGGAQEGEKASDLEKLRCFLDVARVREIGETNVKAER
jgi:hypothetical protein